jgi:hypothetical protein
VIFRNTISDEVVFFHRASNTIIVTDILQSMPRDWYPSWRRLRHFQERVCAND